ncbi:MAG: ceramide glucosyltransferase [Candidatus Methylomirabilia bacterium]
MTLVILAVVVALGLAGLLLQALALRSVLRRRCDDAVDEKPWPPVSILKPLAGLDDNLFSNLESFCRLDYPAYEIIFCLESPNDPAHSIARKVRARNPRIPIAIVISGPSEGHNPKVRNMLAGYRDARHDILLVSDSNVEVEPSYLKATVRPLLDPGVGLVTNPVRGCGGRSLGSLLENLHLNTFVAGGTAFLFRFLHRPCVVGKSMLFRKSRLDALGGLRAFRDVLAEDYVIGREFHRAGLRVVLAPHAVTNVNIHGGTKRFLSRHSRWGKLRRRLGGVRYGAEILLNPVLVAACAMVARPGASSLTLLGVAADGAALCAAWMGRLLDARLPLPLCLLAPVKDLLIATLWFVPLVSMRVSWRGHRLRIGPDTRLVLPGAAAARPRRLRLPAILRTRAA